MNTKWRPSVNILYLCGLFVFSYQSIFAGVTEKIYRKKFNIINNSENRADKQTRNNKIYTFVIDKCREKDFAAAAYFTFFSATTTSWMRAKHVMRDALELQQKWDSGESESIIKILRRIVHDPKLSVRIMHLREEDYDSSKEEEVFSDNEIRTIINALRNYFEKGYNLCSYTDPLPDAVEEKWKDFLRKNSARSYLPSEQIYILFSENLSINKISTNNISEVIFDVFKRKLYLVCCENRKDYLAGGFPPLPLAEDRLSPLSNECTIKGFFAWQKKEEDIKNSYIQSLRPQYEDKNGLIFQKWHELRQKIKPKNPEMFHQIRGQDNTSIRKVAPGNNFKNKQETPDGSRFRSKLAEKLADQHIAAQHTDIN